MILISNYTTIASLAPLLTPLSNFYDIDKKYQNITPKSIYSIYLPRVFKYPIILPTLGPISFSKECKFKKFNFLFFKSHDFAYRLLKLHGLKHLDYIWILCKFLFCIVKKIYDQHRCLNLSKEN
jgi:hypothetical protein